MNIDQADGFTGQLPTFHPEQGILRNSGFSSFSGADYKITLYVPGNRKFYDKARVKELQRELEVLTQATGWNPTVTESIARVRRDLDYYSKRMGEAALTLESLQTLSFQTHRGRKPVVSLGAVYPKGYTSGGRVISGSMIFTVLNEHPLIPIIDAVNGLDQEKELGIKLPQIGRGANNKDLFIPTSAMIDELPPLDAQIIAVNEMGRMSVLYIFGILFINEGLVASVQDLLTEVTVNFVAQDVDPMRTLDTKGPVSVPGFFAKDTISQLLSTKASLARKMRRNYPF